MKDLSHAAGRSFAQRTECYINDFLCMQLKGFSGTHADRLHATPGKSVSLMITKWDVKRNREAHFFFWFTSDQTPETENVALPEDRVPL
jgi:hypothetical protein